MDPPISIAHILLALSCVIGVTVCYPQGAPASRCGTMIPGHGTEGTDSPYQVRALQNGYSEGGQVEVEVSGSRAFSGILIQARESSGDAIVGTFQIPSQFVGLNCDGLVNSAVTHNNGNEKPNPMTFTWSAPANYNRTIYFRATVVQAYELWYTNQRSQLVESENTGFRGSSSLAVTLFCLFLALFSRINIY